MKDTTMPPMVRTTGRLIGTGPARQLNTPQCITEAEVAVVWDATHDPSSEASVNGLLTFNLRFPGQYYDAESGMYYRKNRNCDPPVKVPLMKRLGEIKSDNLQSDCAP